MPTLVLNPLQALRRTSYTCSITGSKINLENRVVHQNDLDVYTGQTQTFFHPLNKTSRIEVKEPRSGKDVWYAKTEKTVLESGLMVIEPNGLWNLHWHKETEHYFVFSGKGEKNQFLINSKKLL